MGSEEPGLLRGHDERLVPSQSIHIAFVECPQCQLGLALVFPDPEGEERGICSRGSQPGRQEYSVVIDKVEEGVVPLKEPEELGETTCLLHRDL